mmetsp:Transcript_28559/g.59645  ORF Transcript_28559/g.59645 Transcript_28559/m.59645 type:complete len:162 (-) Transcript_28559:12-497(-)
MSIETGSLTGACFLYVRVEQVKIFDRNWVVLEAECVRGSLNRLGVGEKCIVNIKSNKTIKVDVEQISQDLTLPSRTTAGPSKKNDTGSWVQPSQSRVVFFCTNKVMEPNRRGIKIIECHSILGIYDGNDDLDEIDQRQETTDASPISVIHEKDQRHRIFAE